jgi:phosphatidylglycerophosphatase A
MIRLAMVTSGGLGLLRPAPGTWGSLPPLLVAGLVGACRPEALLPVLVCMTVVASVCCIWLTPWAETHFGTEDPGQIVIDETAGMALTIVLLTTLPINAPTSGVGGLAVLAGAFAAFRLFDIWKPEPVNALQRLGRGWGVLLDDLMAGVYAAATVAVVLLATGF